MYVSKPTNLVYLSRFWKKEELPEINPGLLKSAEYVYFLVFLILLVCCIYFELFWFLTNDIIFFISFINIIMCYNKRLKLDK